MTWTIETGGKCIDRFSRALSGHHFASDHNRILSKRLGQTFGPRISHSGCDVIFAPNASVEIAFLQTTVPIVYLSDLNWADIVDYYPSGSNLFQFAQLEGERIEAAAIQKASALIYPSPWAARTAVEHYKADSAKVHCIPYGANFENAEIPSREISLNHTVDREINLLWVGVDWERKGGAVACECLKELLRCGVEARLVVCGCVPPAQYRHPNIQVFPFLSKRDPVQRHKLSQLFLQANFFLFPTVAEAFGIVLCEASAYGVPSLARDTGGVGGAVVDGENGYLLPADASGKHYSEKILQIVKSPGRYDELVRSSRRLYEEKLNWDAWGRAVKPIFAQFLGEDGL
jgi:glycosyltransferase involved in cell wall biosynthesis